MSVPIPPWWLRVLNGGNTHNYAIAALAFVVGYYWGKGDKNHWQDIARSADKHWHQEYGGHREHEGRHTRREHERDNDRDYHRHGRS